MNVSTKLTVATKMHCALTMTVHSLVLVTPASVVMVSLVQVSYISHTLIVLTELNVI